MSATSQASAMRVHAARSCASKSTVRPPATWARMGCCTTGPTFAPRSANASPPLLDDLAPGRAALRAKDEASDRTPTTGRIASRPNRACGTVWDTTRRLRLGWFGTNCFRGRDRRNVGEVSAPKPPMDRCSMRRVLRLTVADPEATNAIAVHGLPTTTGSGRSHR